jgi:hypothetical protein
LYYTTFCEETLHGEVHAAISISVSCCPGLSATASSAIFSPARSARHPKNQITQQRGENGNDSTIFCGQDRVETLLTSISLPMLPGGPLGSREVAFRAGCRSLPDRPSHSDDSPDRAFRAPFRRIQGPPCVADVAKGPPTSVPAPSLGAL